MCVRAQVTVDDLGSAGFMLVGVGSLSVSQNTDYLPHEKYNAYGLASTGAVIGGGEGPPRERGSKENGVHMSIST